jgi:D-alanyl-D-alanine carboxypeptidase/D-alanyl-D-alanine-endopeptidase (penicillin-binding protein 4)
VPGTLPTAIVSAALGIVLAAGAVVLAGPWDGGQRAAERKAAVAPARQAAAYAIPPLPPGPAHLPAVAALLPVFAGDSALGASTALSLASVMGPLAAQPGLGKHVGIAVADPASPTLLYDSAASTAFAPASTNKIVTATAALASVGPDHRLATRVVRGPASTGQAPDAAAITLVGGGDPTLSTLPTAPGAAGAAWHPATLDDLATRTAAALQKSGVKSVTLSYDASLYTGPPLQPTWPAGYTYSNIAPVVALMVDEGRVKPTDDLGLRVADPAEQAAAAFAGRLAAHGMSVVGKPAAVSGSAAAPAAGATTGAPGPAELARVESPRLADLVEQMLMVSDNDLAEALLRQVAIADGKPASFEGGVAAVRDVLGPAPAGSPAASGPAPAPPPPSSGAVPGSVPHLGLDLAGLNVLDGSGLSRKDLLSPEFLVRALALAAQTNHPELRAVLTGLPVAGFTGTLADNDRFTAPLTVPAAGLVRAKTGSLTGVVTLAGLVRDADGELLVFAFLADQAPDPVAARAALDRLAAAVAGCGCGGAPSVLPMTPTPPDGPGIPRAAPKGASAFTQANATAPR